VTTLVLAAGERACLTVGPLTFVLQPTQEGRRVGGRARVRHWDREVWMGASLAFHAAILLVFFLMPPRPPQLTLELLPARAHAALVNVERDVDLWFDGPIGGTGTRHEGESGATGSPTAESSPRRFALEGRARPREARPASRSARGGIDHAGALGVLAQLSSAWDVPSSPYASGPAVGADPTSALGALMGDSMGDSLGAGGLGLRGTGRGAGGSGRGTVGLGTLGTLGHGAGTGSGQGYGSGYGAGAGGFRGRRSGVPHTCGPGCAVEVRGSLSREAIRRVVRQHLNEVRFCYEQGLIERPDLGGRVTVSFVVSGTGSVQSASIASSTITSPRVEGCIASAVRRWTFPAPDGASVVLVTYPFVLDSMDG
jgi:TonB family protein